MHDSIQNLFAGAVGPAFDLEDLAIALGTGDDLVSVRATSELGVESALRNAIAKVRRDLASSSPELAGVVALLQAPKKLGLLSSVRVMTGMLRKAYGDEVHLVVGGAVDDENAASKSVAVSVWVRFRGE